MNSIKGWTMSEPITSTAGGYVVLSKLIPILGPVLATIVVMCLATPQSKREWTAALTSTVSMSLFGGSFVVSYFGLNSWAQDSIGLMSITGICFACGLPAWVVVRALFAWMAKQRDKDLAELARAVAKEVRSIKEQ
jgi:predicted PurR-regulated permease PerM